MPDSRPDKLHQSEAMSHEPSCADQESLTNRSTVSGLSGIAHRCSLPTLRASLFGLVAVCVIPAWMVAAGGALWLYKNATQDHSAQRAREAQLLGSAVQAELRQYEARMQTLATSDALELGDYQRLRPMAEQLARDSGAKGLMLLNRSLRVLLHASADRHYALPVQQLKMDRLPRSWKAERGLISDVFVASVRPIHLVSIAVPVIRSGGEGLRLEMVLSPEHFARALMPRPGTGGWRVDLYDRQGVLIANQPVRPEQIGRPARPELAAALARGQDKEQRFKAPDGIWLLASLARIDAVGWTVVVMEPESQSTSELRQTFAWEAAAAFVLLIGGLGWARALAKRVTSSVCALVEPAFSLGRGDRVGALPEPALREVGQLGHALQEAEALLMAREQARSRADLAARHSETRLRLTLEAAEIGDFVVELESGRVITSPGHDRCLGYSEPLSNWTEQRFLSHVHPEDLPEFLEQRDAARAAGRQWQTEFRAIWPDGSLRWLLLRGMFEFECGRAVRAMGVLIDITDRRRAEALRLENARLGNEQTRLTETVRDQTIFHASLSHELRTPLNAVIGLSEILASGRVAPDTPRHAEFLRQIGLSGRHLLALIDDMLALSRAQSGFLDLRPAKLDLTSFVVDALALMRPAFEDKRIQLETELVADEGLIEFDPDRLRQVLLNLLSNAAKYTPENGQVVLRVRSPKGGWVSIEVVDSGIGISKSDLDRLFIPFSRVGIQDGNNQPGTGLGLVLARQIVERMRGRLEVESELGSGSTFKIVLPRSPEMANT